MNEFKVSYGLVRFLRARWGMNRTLAMPNAAPTRYLSTAAAFRVRLAEPQGMGFELTEMDGSPLMARRGYSQLPMRCRLSDPNRTFAGRHFAHAGQPLSSRVTLGPVLVGVDATP